MKRSFSSPVIRVLTMLVLLTSLAVAAPDAQAQPIGTEAPAAGAEAASAAAQPTPPGAEPPVANSKEAAPGAKTWWELEAEKPYEHHGTYWLPIAASRTADGPDSMFIWVLGLSAFFFFAITGAIVYLVIKYRHRPGHKPEPSPAHNDALEITWTVIPTIICVFLFVYGWRSYIDLTSVPETRPENQIMATAQKWNWSFRYYNGVEDNILHVPMDQPVKMTMTSTDVLHSFFVPVFRQKMDVIPRRFTYAYFWPTRPGVYRLYCTEYCGKDHSQMKTKVVVHTAGDYERYLAEAYEKQMNLVGAPLGESVYVKKGCKGCHSLDGSVITGPSFKGTFGTDIKLDNGKSAKFDAEYVRNSILSPGAEARAGVANKGSMPTIAISDKEIEGIVEFLKAQK